MESIKNNIKRDLNDALKILNGTFTGSGSPALDGDASFRTVQKIYYGCPGTGKSRTIKDMVEGENGENIVYFDEKGKKVDDISSVKDKSKITSNIFRTTFHPDYDYSTFVGSYKPVMNPVLDEDGNETGNEDLPAFFHG